MTDVADDRATRLAELDRERARIIDQDGAEDPTAAPADTAPARPQDVWPHDTIDAYGEVWQVRVPTEQAITAVSLASGRFIPMQMQNDVVSLFLKNHLSDASFSRLFERLSDPDDDEFTPATLGEMMRRLTMLTVDRKRAEAEAEAGK